MSTPNNLTNIAVSASGEVDSLLIEKFNGKVQEQYMKGENLLGHFNVETVTGTNTVSNKYLGDTSLQVLAPGQSPNATPTEADKNQVVIDTTVIARNTVAHLHDVQGDIDSLKPKLAMNQTTQLKKMEDQMVVQQLLLGGISNYHQGDNGFSTGGRTKPRVSGHGYSICVEGHHGAFKEEPDYIMAAVELMLEQQLEQEVDINAIALIMPWWAFNCLRDADRIVDKTYTISASGQTVSGFVLSSFNCPVVPSNRFPTQVHSGNNHHLLSNADNGYRYDTMDAMLGAVAVGFTADALLVGRTIDVTGDIFYEKKEKTYYIDTFMAEGAIPDRWEAVGVVLSGRDGGNFQATAASCKTHAEIARRANRKAIRMKTSPIAAAAAFSAEPAAYGMAPADFAAAVTAAIQATVKPAALNPVE